MAKGGSGSKYSEIDGMRAVEEAFDRLEPDERQRVMTWAGSKYAMQVGSMEGGPQQSERKSIQPPKEIKAFMAQKKPSNYYERVACLAYYLEKSEGNSEVKTGDIAKANTDARLSKMSNAAVFVKHATHSYGYLTSLGHRKFALSARGEAVVEALPDPDKVKEAHDNHPFGRKTKKKAKSKK